MPRTTGEGTGSQQGSADHVMHTRARNGRDATGYSAGGRSDCTVVHLRVNGERIRAARGEAGVLRHTPGHAEPGRESSAGTYYATDEGYCGGAPSRRGVGGGKKPS